MTTAVFIGEHICPVFLTANLYTYVALSQTAKLWYS